tara:strand:- start:65 stop:289 length:225 start_codon:yes stop_codon:yes gene_type:complete
MYDTEAELVNLRIDLTAEADRLSGRRFPDRLPVYKPDPRWAYCRDVIYAAGDLLTAMQYDDGVAEARDELERLL